MNKVSTASSVAIYTNIVPCESSPGNCLNMSDSTTSVDNGAALCSPTSATQIDDNPTSVATAATTSQSVTDTPSPGPEILSDAPEILPEHDNCNGHQQSEIREASIEDSDETITSVQNVGHVAAKKRVSFSETPDEVREFTKSENELAAEKIHLEQLKAAREESFAEMKQRWANKSNTFLKVPTKPATTGNDKPLSSLPRSSITLSISPSGGIRNGPQLATSADVDFREIRVISLNRGKNMSPLGVDLLIKPAVAPETGTIVLVKVIWVRNFA